MKHYFLGMAQEYAGGEWLRHLLTIGRKRDLKNLENYLSKRYQGEAMLCKNGRSSLTLALKANFEPGDAVIVNGFTCYAVYEAVKEAELTPIFADISREDLNFDIEKLNAILENSRVRGIIVQNTLGNPTDIGAIENLAEKYDLKIVEDLAHCAGVHYSDGREVGTVGVATALSFGKEKSIDTVSGGAVVFRGEAFIESEGVRSAAAREVAREPRGGLSKESSKERTSSFFRDDDRLATLVDGRERRAPRIDKSSPLKAPKPSDHLRAKFYPMFGALTRTLTYVGIGGAVMRCLVKIHWVERSADNKLDTSRRCSKFEAKLALKQLKRLRKNGEMPIREFCFVHDRDKCLKELKRKGYYFGGFWYEKPVSPERYYKNVHFDEMNCQNACYVAEHIINLPIYYTRRDLTPALKIIKKYLEEEA